MSTPDAVTPFAWQDNALCAEVGTEMFFPDKGASSRPAKAICAACPVRAECLTYAINFRVQFGVFGGLTPRQRHDIRKQVA